MYHDWCFKSVLVFMTLLLFTFSLHNNSKWFKHYWNQNPTVLCIPWHYINNTILKINENKEIKMAFTFFSVVQYCLGNIRRIFLLREKERTTKGKQINRKTKVFFGSRFLNDVAFSAAVTQNVIFSTKCILNLNVFFSSLRLSVLRVWESIPRLRARRKI